MSAICEKIWNAVEARDLEALRSLLKVATATDLAHERQSNGEHKTALLLAVGRDMEEFVALLIAAGSDVNQHSSDEYGRTCLMLAAMLGCTAVHQLLINAGADVNAKSKNGVTALMYAARNGNAAEARALLEAGADRSITSNWGETAAQEAMNDSLRTLINNFVPRAATTALADLPAPPPVPSKTIASEEHTLSTTGGLGEQIYDAVDTNNTDQLRTLLRKAAKKDLGYERGENDNKHTALTLAVEKEDAVAVQLLIDAGVDVDQKSSDEYGRSALMMAAMFGCTAIFELLLKAGAKLDIICTYGMTALMYAARNHHLTEVKLLLDAGADASIKSNWGETAADEAGSEEIRTFINTYGSRTPSSPAPEGLLSDQTRSGDSPSPVAPEPDVLISVAALESECDAFVAQAAAAPHYLRKNQLQSDLDAADAVGTDFERIAALGKALKAVKLQCAQLALSEEDCRTLAPRQAELVARVTERCRQLRVAEEFDALGRLGSKLTALRALDLSGLPPPPGSNDGDSDPVYVPPTAGEEDASANDPVWVPNL